MRFNGIWNSFTAAPHRVMFFGGALQTLLVMAWWLVELLARNGTLAYSGESAIPVNAIHAFLMIYGLFPFFMYGFLMTTFPRWLGRPEIPRAHFVPAFVLLFAGDLLYYAGLRSGTSVLVAAAAIMLAGWLIALYALYSVLRVRSHQDKRHTRGLFAALCMGWLGLASYLLWLVTGSQTFLSFAVQGGLWFFLLPVFVSVGHRMIPFFTSSALPQYQIPRPFWPWWVMLGCSVLHGGLQLAELPNAQWPFDLLLAASSLYLSYVWGFRRSLRNPLLGVLHVAFAWVGIAMLLFALQGAANSFTWGISLGLAPLHALTIGCFATLVIGMGTRVTLGHSGLPFNIDTAIKLMFVGLQLVAVLRVGADLFPNQASFWMYIAAAVVWLLSFTPWVLRYLPAYWRPRADGQPG